MCGIIWWWTLMVHLIFSLRAFFEYRNFLLFPFSSTITYPIRVGLSVNGQISITLEASIAFSNFTIWPGVVPDFFMCRVTTFIHFTTTLFVLRKTFRTSAFCPRSFFFSWHDLNRISCSYFHNSLLLFNYKTSGAKLTIFWYPFVLSSRATGPKIRVHLGLPSSPIITHALSSNLR